MKSTRNWRTGLLAGVLVVVGAAAALGCNALLGNGDGDAKPGAGGDGTRTDSQDPDGSASKETPGPGSTTNAPDASTSKDSKSSTGPGPYGALPTGYCCSRNEQCRSRHCADVGSGGSMCLDACRTSDACSRDDLTGFTCSSTSQFEDGWCQPPTPSFKCIDQGLFPRGTTPTGGCCTATYDGNAGQECAGNICGQWGQDGHYGPFICTNWCEKHADCSQSMYCLENLCVPSDIASYTCQ